MSTPNFHDMLQRALNTHHGVPWEPGQQSGLHLNREIETPMLAALKIAYEQGKIDERERIIQTLDAVKESACASK